MKIGTRLVLLAIVTVMIISASAMADTVTFSLGNYSQNNILNSGVVGTTFDNLTFTGGSGSFALAGGSSLTTGVGNLNFQEGTTCYFGSTCEQTQYQSQTGTMSFDATINGITQTISMGYTACLGQYNACGTTLQDDWLILADSGVYNFGNINLQVTGGTLVSTYAGNSVELQGQFANVPEPSTFALAIMGVAFFGTLRKRIFSVR